MVTERIGYSIDEHATWIAKKCYCRPLIEIHLQGQPIPRLAETDGPVPGRPLLQPRSLFYALYLMHLMMN